MVDIIVQTFCTLFLTHVDASYHSYLQEIVDFVDDAVFNIDSSNCKPNAQKQWVEVISAEPPVRRAIFSIQ